jgi:hypothetical protein
MQRGKTHKRMIGLMLRDCPYDTFMTAVSFLFLIGFIFVNSGLYYPIEYQTAFFISYSISQKLMMKILSVVLVKMFTFQKK